MIYAVAPEPAPWVHSLPLLAEALHVRVKLLAPWAPAGVLGRLPGLGRRQMKLSGVEVESVPFGLAADLLLGAATPRSVPAQMAARFARRRLLGRLAVARLPDDAECVIAPSLAARRLLAEARARGLQAVLVEDLPDLDGLHRDLERAAQAHPDAAFLRRFRAPHALLVRQAQERMLATRILVRSQYALDRIHAQTPGIHHAALWPFTGAVAAGRALLPPRPRFLLAGLATARGGAVEAVAALANVPGATLLVRTGEGTEPRHLLQLPHVQEATAPEREQLLGVTAVLAPSWVESHPPEVALACAQGVPVIATRRAAGPFRTSEVEPGDVLGLVHQLQAAAQGALGPPTPLSGPPWGEALGIRSGR